MNQKNRNYVKESMQLLTEQKNEWEALRKGYESLSFIRTKTIEFENYSFTIQFNPQRITSTAALTDSNSIKERKCFLCTENRPEEQREIELDGFILLCNPFPIFPEHFTITAKEHIPQAIKNNFNKLLNLTKDLQSSFAVFYNGPECGASAPDHLHFQAGTLNHFPIFNELKEIVRTKHTTEIRAINDGLRKMLLLRGNNENELTSYFTNIYDVLKKHSDPPEPKINIIACYREEWEIVIFLREKHRPDEFFLEGKNKITFSPAAVDCAGLCITPIEKDFLLFNKELLAKIFQQVFISKEKFNIIYLELQKFFTDILITHQVR